MDVETIMLAMHTAIHLKRRAGCYYQIAYYSFSPVFPNPGRIPGGAPHGAVHSAHRPSCHGPPCADARPWQHAISSHPCKNNRKTETKTFMTVSTSLPFTHRGQNKSNHPLSTPIHSLTEQHHPSQTPTINPPSLLPL